LEIESLQIQLVKDLKMKSSWTWAVGGAISNNWCPYEERREHKKTHKEGHVKEEVEI